MTGRYLKKRGKFERFGGGTAKVTLKQVSARKKNIAVARASKKKLGKAGVVFKATYLHGIAKGSEGFGFSKSIARSHARSAVAQIAPTTKGKKMLSATFRSSAIKKGLSGSSVRKEISRRMDFIGFGAEKRLGKGGGQYGKEFKKSYTSLRGQGLSRGKAAAATRTALSVGGALHSKLKAQARTKSSKVIKVVALGRQYRKAGSKLGWKLGQK